MMKKMCFVMRVQKMVQVQKNAVVNILKSKKSVVFQRLSMPLRQRRLEKGTEKLEN